MIPNERHAGTQRKLRTAPTPVLERTKRLYGRVGTVAWLVTPTCLLLGVWVDWRWLVTGLLPLFTWALAHQVTDLIDAELDRRRQDQPPCPDRLG